MPGYAGSLLKNATRDLGNGPVATCFLRQLWVILQKRAAHLHRPFRTSCTRHSYLTWSAL
ncbi:hypothetical protein COO20_04575 [Thalassospira marina]|uniref:Uncharacterized protein n=1 Tax=Thalassospira marina TaxID=2048283 RepID=A0A2N3KY80_9PROT|nr:hypothetical protein COO20_04575 [Thalassospira marina]